MSKLVNKYLCDCGAIWGLPGYQMYGETCPNCSCIDFSKVVKAYECCGRWYLENEICECNNGVVGVTVAQWGIAKSG